MRFLQQFQFLASHDTAICFYIGTSCFQVLVQMHPEAKEKLSRKQSKLILLRSKQSEQSGLEPLAHKWSEEECKILWTYMEDWQDELYHGKGALTHPRVIARITSMLSTRQFPPLSFLDKW